MSELFQITPPDPNKKQPKFAKCGVDKKKAKRMVRWFLLQLENLP